MTQNESPPPLLTVREVARILRVSPSLVYQLVETRKLASHRVGNRNGAIRIAPADLDDYLACCRPRKGGRPAGPPQTKQGSSSI